MYCWRSYNSGCAINMRHHLASTCINLIVDSAWSAVLYHLAHTEEEMIHEHDVVSSEC